MNKFNWLHLSDLHFGNSNPQMKRMREAMLKYISNIKENAKIKYVFITGDLLFAPHYFKETQNQDKIREETITFIRKLGEILELDLCKFFIVPGNHDVERPDGEEKEKLIKELRTNYKDELTVESTDKLFEYQKYYNNICNELAVKYCHAGHEYVDEGQIALLMLNTAVTSYNSDEDKTHLLLGQNMFDAEVGKIKGKKPLFILAHHSPEWFCQEDENHIKTSMNLLKNQNEVFYLCGHEHRVVFRGINSDDVHYIFCGTNLIRDKKADEIYDMKFLIGRYDLKNEEVCIEGHKCKVENEKWKPDRDISEYPPYYRQEILIKHHVRKDICGATSETEARTKYEKCFIDRIQECLKIDNCNYTEPIAEFVREMLSTAKYILDKKPHYTYFKTFIDNLYPTLSSCRTYEEIYDLLGKKQYERIHATNQINSKAMQLCETLLRGKGSEDELGILLYSKSTTIIDMLKSLISYSKKIHLYICEGSVRNAIGDYSSYEDAKNMANELADCLGFFKEITVIPDIYFYELVKEKKIDLVFMGAHDIIYDATGIKGVVNTSGSSLIMRIAKECGVRCYFVADSSKYQSKEDFNFKQNEIDKSMQFGNSQIQLNYCELEHIASEISIENLIVDRDPKENYNYCDECVLQLFANDILKDRRKLEMISNTTIRKWYNTEEDENIEYAVLQHFKNEQSDSMPSYKKKEKEFIDLEYYKGTRIFNLLTMFKRIIDNDCDESLKKKINIYISQVIEKCEKNQINIQKGLFNFYNNSAKNMFSVYPREKLLKMIKVLFYCYKLEDNYIDEKLLMEEAEKVYGVYKKGAIVPFRDASSKNMILNCETLFVPNMQDKARYEFIKSMCSSGEMESIIKNSKIIDIDFCTCLNLTTPYDDEISFKFHERTSDYYDFRKVDNWLADVLSLDDEMKNNVIASTFIIRYLRFGGRKALYKLLDKKDYDVRFKYDDEVFYFKRMPEIIEYYWRNAKIELPQLLLFFEHIARKMERQEPYFNIDSNYEKKIREMTRKKTYEDIFWECP